MVNKAIKVALGILILLVVLVIGLVGGGYLYLKPDKGPPRLASQNTVRVVENGELIGFESQNDTYAWLGIPYAAPPVGELRWKAPRPPERWTGRFEALEFGPACFQTEWDVFSQNTRIWAMAAALNRRLGTILKYVNNLKEKGISIT